MNVQVINAAYPMIVNDYNRLSIEIDVYYLNRDCHVGFDSAYNIHKGNNSI